MNAINTTRWVVKSCVWIVYCLVRWNSNACHYPWDRHAVLEGRERRPHLLANSMIVTLLLKFAQLG